MRGGRCCCRCPFLLKISVEIGASQGFLRLIEGESYLERQGPAERRFDRSWSFRQWVFAIGSSQQICPVALNLLQFYQCYSHWMPLAVHSSGIVGTLVGLEEQLREELGGLPFLMVAFHVMLQQPHFLACFTQFLDLGPNHLCDPGFQFKLWHFPNWAANHLQDLCLAQQRPSLLDLQQLCYHLHPPNWPPDVLLRPLSHFLEQRHPPSNQGLFQIQRLHLHQFPSTQSF